MKQLIHKSIAICMAFVVLTTTMSFTVDMHFCGNTMVDFAFFNTAKSCGMDKLAIDSGCETPSLSKKSCCSDKQLIVDGQDNLQDTFHTLNFEQQIFVVAFVCSYSTMFEDTSTEKIRFTEYPPPFLKRDVQVLHQTFLI